MKKFLALLLGALLALASVAAMAEGKLVLTGANSYLGDAAKLFEEEFGIEVEFRHQGETEMIQRLLRQMSLFCIFSGRHTYLGIVERQIIVLGSFFKDILYPVLLVFTDGITGISGLRYIHTIKAA